MRSSPLPLSAIACTITLLLHISLATALPRDDVEASIKPLTKTELSDLGTLYKDLHRAPELSFEEKATSRRVAAELRTSGFEVTENVGGFGVVAVLKNGTGPTVMIRTDMDALPIIEETGASYASTVKTTVAGGQESGVMHACGHDVHIASIIGTARVLAQLREHWQGTLMVIATRLPKFSFTDPLTGYILTAQLAGLIRYCLTQGFAWTDRLSPRLPRCVF